MLRARINIVFYSVIKVDRRSVVGTHLSANRQKYLPVEVLREASVPVLMIVMLSAANFEVLKLLPWTSDKYDGYPMKRAMKLDATVILMQTLPMIALSLVFRKKQSVLIAVHFLLTFGKIGGRIALGCFFRDACAVGVDRESGSITLEQGLH